MEERRDASSYRPMTSRRSIFYRILCAIFGLSASAKKADAAVESALKVCNPKPWPPIMDWTVKFKNGTEMKVKASATTTLPINFHRKDLISGEPVTEEVRVLMFTDADGNVVGRAALRDVACYGCSYPPVKIEYGYLQREVKFCPPINP
jgi:hypothetical protein